MGTPTAFSPAVSFLVTIPTNDSLFILHSSVSDSCLETCVGNASFKWRCTLNTGYDSSFCDSCFGSKELTYYIQNSPLPVLHIDRLYLFLTTKPILTLHVLTRTLHCSGSGSLKSMLQEMDY
ncbi:MAG: hypothetical protein IPK10_06770 [Bacteroidetes bacterium]|nr:hypothetical protein [Bacteroidota bacterium]